MQLENTPIARAEMLIRRPVTEVFNAFVDPAVTTKFWFTKSTGRLEASREVRWEWEMYGVSSKARVKVLDPDRRIVIEWSGSDAPTTVEWLFSARADDSTFVSITHSGFAGDGDAIVRQTIESTEGFTLVLAGCKAFLEHGILLNLVGDRFPKEPEKP
jgi:uncharacterized protein YndB with AHSA1/START domain